LLTAVNVHPADNTGKRRRQLGIGETVLCLQYT
jgi:hypothetical protein